MLLSLQYLANITVHSKLINFVIVLFFHYIFILLLFQAQILFVRWLVHSYFGICFMYILYTSFLLRHVSPFLQTYFRILKCFLCYISVLYFMLKFYVKFLHCFAKFDLSGLLFSMPISDFYL